jgi:hypothetical protein
VTRGGAALALVLATLAATPAPSLRTLHVDALSMRADKTRLHVGEVFHLAIHVHVRENVPALDELVIPDVGNMQLEGDERQVTHAASGTDIVETLTLEPTSPGTFTFAGAYVDAINARDGRPSRFRANAVTVHVDGSSAIGVSFPTPYFWMLARVIGGIALAGFAIIAAGAVLVAIVRRRRRIVPAPVVPRVAAPVAPPPRTPRDDVADALRAYKAIPQTDALMRLRAALFHAAGVAAGVTLRDALAATGDHGLRGALIAAERTAFGPAYARDPASAELVDAVEAWLR